MHTLLAFTTIARLPDAAFIHLPCTITNLLVLVHTMLQTESQVCMAHLVLSFLSCYCPLLTERLCHLQGLDLSVKNFLTSVPLVADLRSPAMRERHWTQLMTTTKVSL